MPLAPQGHRILTHNRLSTSPTLWRSPLRSLRRTTNAPGPAVNFDVGYSFEEWIAAFAAEEVALVVDVAHCCLVVLAAFDGRFAVVTAGSEEFVPVKVAVEAESFIAVGAHGFFPILLDEFTGHAAGYAVEASGADFFGLGGYVHVAQSLVAVVAPYTCWMKPLA